MIKHSNELWALSYGLGNTCALLKAHCSKLKARKSQFFLIAFVFVAITFFVIFTYFQTIDKSSILMSEPSPLFEIENLANSFRTRNLWLSGYWWNISWSNRTLVNITALTGNALVEIDAGITGECINAVRVVNTTGAEINSNVTATTSLCNVTFNANVVPGKYYIYWNNPDATIPAYRCAGCTNKTNNYPTYTTGPETIPYTELCTHLKAAYPRLGLALNCSSLLEK